MFALQKNGAAFRSAFCTLIDLSTKLIDPSWDTQMIRSFSSSGNPSLYSKDKQQNIVNLVYDRMFRKLQKELFKGAGKGNQKENAYSNTSSTYRSSHRSMSGKVLLKEQFLYQMDDYTQVSRYLL